MNSKMYPRSRCLTTNNKILDILNENDSDLEADGYIDPRDVKELTGEDSGNGDGPDTLKPRESTESQGQPKKKEKRWRNPSRIRFGRSS